MSKAKKQTGLQVTRSGGTFTCSWKTGESYSHQRFEYSVNWGKWTAIAIKKGTTSQALSWSIWHLHPYGWALKNVRFRVKGKTSKKTWCNWQYGQMSLTAPKAPSASMAVVGTEAANFSWSASADASAVEAFTVVEYQHQLTAESQSPNWNVTAIKDASAEKSIRVNESSQTVATGSHTRWFRIRSRGMNGDSGWVTTKRVYATPKPAVILNHNTTQDASGITGWIQWQTSPSSAYPIDTTDVEYIITEPAEDVSLPTGQLSWTKAGGLITATGKDAISFATGGTLKDDECLFARVNTVHEERTAYGAPVLMRTGYLADAENLSITDQDISTFTATVHATNKSSVADSFLVITFKTEDESLDIGIIPHGEDDLNVKCPDWSQTNAEFGVRAVVGSYTFETRDDGVKVYHVTEKMSSKNTIWEGGALPVAPANVTVTATDVAGSVRVGWEWTWKNAHSAIISWADHKDAWESTDEPEEYTISNLHPSYWNIAGLEVGKKWYVRVRLVGGTQSAVTNGPWSVMESIDLSSAPATPSLVLSADVVKEGDILTAYWSYVSTDGKAQSYAEICEADVDGGSITYGNVIAHTETAQHIDIDPFASELGWSAGETHYLCVRVVSGANKSSEGWSAPVPVSIAVPLEAEITETSLVDEVEEVNPQTYSGEMISFESENVAPIAKSLKVTLEPIQDLHGYDKPWAGGAGKNKWNGKWVSAVFVETDTWSAELFAGNNAMPIKEGETYTASLNGTLAGIRYVFLDANKNEIGSLSNANTTTPAPSGAKYLRWRERDPSVENGKYQLELGSSATSYEPYSNICPISGRTEVVTWDDPKYGGTVAWNQLLTNAQPTRTINGVTFTNNEDGTYTINGTATADATFALSGGSDKPAHKVLLCGCPAGGSPSSYILWDGYAGWFDSGNGTVKPFANSGNWGILITVKSGITVDNIVFKPQLFDLTQMFGSTIADYIYSLEQANAGAGVAYFRNLFPNDYYEYNAGETTCVSAVNGDPYNHYTTTLGRTVYGGTLEQVGGQLTDKMGMVDLGTLNWIPYDGNRFAAPAANNVPVQQMKQYANTEVANIVCSQYETHERDTLTNGQISLHYSGQNYVNIIDTNYSDAQSFKTAMRGVQLCYELANPQTIQLTPQQVQLLLGNNNVWSDGDVTLDTADALNNVIALKQMPLTVTITGAGAGGVTTLIAERASDYPMERPDETNFDGYEGEIIALARQTGEGEITVNREDLLGSFDDGARYRLVATVQDSLGQTDRAELPFTVHWTHQAVVPDATVEMLEGGVAKITPIKPTGWEDGDTCDIYRLSADRPELIVEGAEFGTAYVDPYSAIGEFGGHRIVYRTADGDYITEEDNIAWLDLDEDAGDVFDSKESIIDFDGEQVLLKHNVDLSNQWEKDFRETKYLGGSIQGDWNAGVKRSGSATTTTINIIEQDTIRALRRLAVYEGICHIRTVDGSSYPCDIQVSEDRSSDKYNATASFSLAITRVDAQELDGMTYAQWLELQNELE